ncbi:target of rapamycin (TOR) kinase 1 [Trypanosoma cruzi]|nr:target of rapamycin (TOR) kinase 1 [Trypanosoma cruzi]
MDNTLLSCGGENHRFETTMDRVAARQEQRRPLRGECSSFTYFPLFAACDGGGRFLPGLKGILQVSLPRETRHLFRCRVEDGTLVELTRLPMGYKASQEILQMVITSAIAVVTTVVHRLWAAPPSARVDVWIDNIRIAGSIGDATSWEAQVLRNADSCHAKIGKNANRAPRSTPSCGCGLITLTVRYP